MTLTILIILIGFVSLGFALGYKCGKELKE